MKGHILSLFLVVTCMGCKQKQAIVADVSKDSRKFTVHRGTNIAHWLSQSERRDEQRDSFFTRKDIDFIDSVGFDHIRLPVDEEQLWDENGKRHEHAFTLLNNCITWCNQAGLRIILDLHILRSHHFNAKEKPLWTKPEEQEKFIRLWKDLSDAVHKWPNDMLAYEFMNEPVADDASQWNSLLARVADSIRSWEPERVLVIGSNRWQSVNTFDELEVPPDDENILLSFHFYEPFYLTHYQASWTRLKDFQGKVNYPGQIVDGGTSDDERRIYHRDSLEKMMEKPLVLAAKLNLPLYCGEFGVIDKAPVEAKLAWYRDMVAIFEKHGVGYANWNFKAGSFGIVDGNLVPDEPMIKVLTKSEAQ